jgi:hypothetical protein
MTSRHIRNVIVAAVLVLAAGAFVVWGRGIWYPLFLQISGTPTIASVVKRYGPAARARLKPHFARAGVSYPPKKIALLVFKRERRVSLWVDGRFIRAYPILAASGHAGPKLRQGDYQVPEGVYRIEWLNPASSYHLSMKVSYPNAFDRQQAAIDHRTRLGGDIFIHGKNVSIGCIALGDPAIEEVFTLAADTGIQRIRVIIAPNDLRVAGAAMAENTPLWVAGLYRTIAAALAEFPVWMESNSAMDVPGMRKAPKALLAR